MPKALKSCPKSIKSPDLVTLFTTTYIDYHRLFIELTTVEKCTSLTGLIVGLIGSLLTNFLRQVLCFKMTFHSQANDKGDNSTEIKASDTRLNPTYMLYYTISQIFHPTLTTGILPMAALIYMNASIFFGNQIPYFRWLNCMNLVT